MPYIALQLIGIETVFHALGIKGELPLVAAFLILALNTYSAGLRAPALIAIVKGTLIYIVVLAAISLVPYKLGGYGAVFEAAGAAFKAKGSGGLLLSPAQYAPYVSLALGSALALFMYPHAMTGILASASANTIRKNAMLLPAYSVALALIALMGLMGHAAGLKLSNKNDVVPLLFKILFPGWFAGFAFVAIAIGALRTRRDHEHRHDQSFHPQFLESLYQSRRQRVGAGRVAKMTSLAVVAGALLFILFLPTQFLRSICNCWVAYGSANFACGDFRPLHGLVPGTRLARRMGGWFFGRQLACLAEWFQAPAHAAFRRRQHHALFGSARARGEHSRSHSRERGAAACRARGSRPCAGRLTVHAGASIPRR
jgi:Na+/proline symporter